MCLVVFSKYNDYLVFLFFRNGFNFIERYFYNRLRFEFVRFFGFVYDSLKLKVVLLSVFYFGELKSSEIV